MLLTYKEYPCGRRVNIPPNLNLPKLSAIIEHSGGWHTVWVLNRYTEYSSVTKPNYSCLGPGPLPEVGGSEGG